MSALLWQVPRSDESSNGLSARSPRLEADRQDGKTDQVDAATHDVPENNQLENIPNLNRYEKVSDVLESRVWFASKNLTPCRIN